MPLGIGHGNGGSSGSNGVQVAIFIDRSYGLVRNRPRHGGIVGISRGDCGGQFQGLSLDHRNFGTVESHAGNRIGDCDLACGRMPLDVGNGDGGRPGLQGGYVTLGIDGGDSLVARRPYKRIVGIGREEGGCKLQGLTLYHGSLGAVKRHFGWHYHNPDVAGAGEAGGRMGERNHTLAGSLGRKSAVGYGGHILV